MLTLVPLPLLGATTARAVPSRIERVLQFLQRLIPRIDSRLTVPIGPPVSGEEAAPLPNNS